MTAPTSCPGCGAPYSHLCAWCGRVSHELMEAAPRSWKEPHVPASFALGYCTMSNGQPYIPPGRKPERLRFIDRVFPVLGGFL